jgi:hypothetical protein
MQSLTFLLHKGNDKKKNKRMILSTAVMHGIHSYVGELTESFLHLNTQHIAAK